MISRLKVRIGSHHLWRSVGLDNLPGGPLMVLEGFTYIPHRFAHRLCRSAPRGVISLGMTGDNQNCTAGAVVRRPTPTGRRCAICCAATPSRCAADYRQPHCCYSCTDRMTVVDVRRRAKVVPYKNERYSIERKAPPLRIRSPCLPLSKVIQNRHGDLVLSRADCG